MKKSFQWISVLSCILFAVPLFAQTESAEILGIPWTGGPGVTETVEQIMQRELEFPPDRQFRMGLKPKRTRPDRRLLSQNPLSPEVASWPINANRGLLSPTVSPQTLGVSFTGATLSGTNPTFSFPPDVMGDVGPSQYIVAVNGRIVSFNKATGTADGALNASMDGFFTSVRNLSSTSDPRIRYDRISGRWFVIIINVASTNNRVLLAVSSGPTITSSANFTFYFFQHNTVSPAGNTGHFADYPTLGIDVNALYIGLNMFNGGSFHNVTAFVVRKSSITSGGPIVVSAFRDLLISNVGPYTPQGVDNFDTTATQGYFIGVDNATFGTLMLRRVSTPGGTPTMSGNISLTVPATSYPANVRHSGNTGGTNGRLSAVDDRLFQAVIRNGRLWTAHSISVNNTGVASGTTTRNGSRWYEIQNLATTPSVVQSGTVFTATGTNTVDERNYWFPSVMVSGQGHAAMGFSTAGTSEFANAGTVGRLATDVLGTVQTPVVYTSSATAYNPAGDPGDPSFGRRWGDYSYTSLDPNDDMTMWTIQQFCNSTNSYGVRVVQLIAPPPATPASVAPPSISSGLASVVVTVTGTSISGSGFFDPGAGFTNRIAASVTGVTVNSVTYVNPTTVTLDLNTTAATAGAKNVTVTNPDAQNRTGIGILTVTSAASVAVTVPNGGETWTAGATELIQWTSAGLPGDVKIDLSTDAGASFNTIFASTANDGSENYLVTGPATGTARIRVSSVSGPVVDDTSNADFTIVQPTLTITTPNGGEVWPEDSIRTIEWNSSNLSGNVVVLLSRNGGTTFPETLFANTTNDGDEDWLVSGTGTTTARIKVVSVSIPTLADTSDADFSIASPTVAVSIPNGGESVLVDSVLSIQWTSAFLSGNVLIEVSRDGGGSYDTLFASTPDDGTEDWTVTGPTTTDAIVRISDAANTIVADASNGAFSINVVKSITSIDGWNMISLPVTIPDRRKSQVFPAATSQAFGFSGLTGYVAQETLQYGGGYWLKFPSVQNVSVVGGLREHDTITVHAGWNLIGSITNPVPVDSIIQIPGGIVSSFYYGYGNPSYVATDTIHALQAYWVKTNQPGQLVLPGGTAIFARPRSQQFRE